MHADETSEVTEILYGACVAKSGISQESRFSRNSSDSSGLAKCARCPNASIARLLLLSCEEPALTARLIVLIARNNA